MDTSLVNLRPKGIYKTLLVNIAASIKGVPKPLSHITPSSRPIFMQSNSPHTATFGLKFGCHRHINNRQPNCAIMLTKDDDTSRTGIFQLFE